MQIAKILSVVFGFALLTAACGDSMSSLNPSAPSAVSAGTVHVEASGVDVASGSMANGPKPGDGNGNGNNNGKGNGNGNGNDKGKRTPTNTSPGTVVTPLLPGLSKVELEGLISEVDADSITVNQQTVMVTDDTVIRHGNRRFELADLHEGDRVHVKAMRVSSSTNAGASATLQAVEVKLQREGDAANDEENDEEENDDRPSVTVQASDAAASESGRDTGTFRVSRSGSKWAAPITVTFTLTGTATNGTDYANVPLTVTFGRGDDRVNVVVRPTADTLAEGTETVILTLTPGSSYRLGSGAAATIRISDAASR
jgi:hypothetical protein